MRRRLLIALLWLEPAVAAGQQRTDGPSTRVPDTIVAYDGRRLAAERTTLHVTHRVGRDTVGVEVAYWRLASSAAEPGSPIVFLMGGPGVPASVMAPIPPYFALFERLTSVADVILLDQRGTGRSRPSLDCSGGSPPSPDFLASRARLRASLVATYAPCVAAWRERGYAPELFSVRAIADDLEVIRTTLGAARLSLLGFSYGTRLALEYARLHPDHTDRVVLQGVLGPEHGVRLPTTVDALLDRVVDVAPGDVRAALGARLGALDRRPLTVPVATVSGDAMGFVVGRQGLEALVTQALADRRLPALLEMLARDDTRLLAIMVGAIHADLAAGGGGLFGRAVYCSAPPSTERIGAALDDAAGKLLGFVFDNVPVSPDFCRDIGIGPGMATPSGTFGGTALLIEGTLDDRTPMGNAAEIAPRFATASIVTVKHGGHELLPASDIRDLVVAFFGGTPVPGHTITWQAPRFPGVQEALQPPRARSRSPSTRAPR